MSSKSRKLKAKVLNPSRTRRKEFKCSACLYASYSARDYKILYEAKKIVFFSFPPTSKKVYCNECLIEAVAVRAGSLDLMEDEKVDLLVLDGDNSYIIKVQVDYE